MTTKMSKFEALQSALEHYFNRNPRLTIKALSMRTSVPYATLRRIINSEVNEIKDETIFRVINRVMHKHEQVEFIRRYYPILETMSPILPEMATLSNDLTRTFKRFMRMSPHNLILKLIQTKSFINRRDIERLTGEYGLSALDEMLGAGLVVEESDRVSVHPELEHVADVEDIRHQIIKDVEYIPATLNPEVNVVRHICKSISPEGVSQIVDLAQGFLAEVGDVVKDDSGEIPFFFDLVSGIYDGTPFTSKLVRPKDPFFPDTHHEKSTEPEW